MALDDSARNIPALLNGKAGVLVVIGSSRASHQASTHSGMTRPGPYPKQ